MKPIDPITFDGRSYAAIMPINTASRRPGMNPWSPFTLGWVFEMNESVERFISILKRSLNSNDFPSSKVSIAKTKLETGAKNLGVSLNDTYDPISELGIDVDTTSESKNIFSFNEIAIRDTSYNFDYEMLDLNLKRTMSIPGIIHADGLIDTIWSDIKSVKIDNEKRFSYKIHYHGYELNLGISVFMDDHKSPDIEIFCHPWLNDQFDVIYEEICDELGN